MAFAGNFSNRIVIFAEQHVHLKDEMTSLLIPLTLLLTLEAKCRSFVELSLRSSKLKIARTLI